VEIIVHDTASAMAELLAAPIEQRADALREILRPVKEAMPWMGDIDLVDMHHRGCGFRVDRDDDRYLAALRRMSDAGVRERISASLSRAWAHQSAATPGIRHADTVNVILVLGDPDDDHLVVRNKGYFGMGSFPGLIHLTLWPTDENIDRIGGCAVHELNHNIRYSNVVWDPATVTVGEQIVSEGLAEAFVREVAGAEAMGPWATSLEGAELDSAYDKIVAALGVTGMENFTAYVHGDGTAERMGVRPVGLPDLAGYPVGLRIVDAHFAASGLTAAQSTALPREQILANAGL
jgi:uncharacterized protein YjaZ